MQINANIVALDLIVEALHTLRTKKLAAFMVADSAFPNHFEEQDFVIPQIDKIMEDITSICDSAVSDSAVVRGIELSD